MNKKEFMSLIETVVKKVVAEEIKTQLPSIMERVITENYLRNLVSSKPTSAPTPKIAKRNGSPSLFEILGVEDEPEEYNEVPKPEKNTDLGVYQGRPSVKEREQTNEVKNKLLDPSQNPLAFLYEGINPQVQTAPVDAPVEYFGLDKKNMMELAGINTKKRVDEDDLQRELEMKEQLLEIKRKSLQSQQISAPKSSKKQEKESGMSKVLERAMEKRSKYDFGMR